MLVEAGGYFVAEIDGRAAGCGGWSDAVPTVAGLPLPAPRAEVRAMFVLPEFAGRGVGRALLRAAEEAAAAAGYEQAYLVATLSGYDFYLKAGYAPLSQHTVPIPGGGVIGVTCMVREIQ
jgi:GNAT superfamily N-acetyltransferase